MKQYKCLSFQNSYCNAFFIPLEVKSTLQSHLIVSFTFHYGVIRHKIRKTVSQWHDTSSIWILVSRLLEYLEKSSSHISDRAIKRSEDKANRGKNQCSLPLSHIHILNTFICSRTFVFPFMCHLVSL